MTSAPSTLNGTAATPAPSPDTDLASFDDRLRRHNEEIRAHFEALAPEYPGLKQRNAYYNDYLVRWCRALVPPGRRVLDIGSGRGDVLDAVQPGEGLGLDLSPEMSRRATMDFPRFEFRTVAVEDFVSDK